MKKINRQKGFTLIELLVVIAIIAILAVVVFVALNPAQRFADARDSRRWSSVNNILTAVHESIVDNGGVLPTGLTTSMASKELGTCVTCADITASMSAYLKTLPIDPSGGTVANTGYSIDVDANNIITVTADNAESGVVAVSR